MDYDLTRLGSREFEHLTQALAAKIIGHGVSVFGDGPDGGREASFKGKTQFPALDPSEAWDGYVVLQSKFRGRPLGAPQDGNWFMSEIRKELNEWADRKSSRNLSGKIPDYLILATNIVLTPAAGSGGVDQANLHIDKLCRKLNIPIKGWKIWHHDQICTYLDIYPEVRQTYAGMTTSGDVLFWMREKFDQIAELGISGQRHRLPDAVFRPGADSDVVDATFADEMGYRVAMHHALKGRGLDAGDFWSSMEHCLRSQGHRDIKIMSMEPYNMLLGSERWRLDTQWAKKGDGVEVRLSEIPMGNMGGDDEIHWFEDPDLDPKLCALGVRTEMVDYAAESDRIFVFHWERIGSRFFNHLYEIPRSSLLAGLRAATESLFAYSDNDNCVFVAKLEYADLSGMNFSVRIDPYLGNSAIFRKSDCVDHGSWIIN
ncbi:hypothetical protein ABZ815_02055 [Nonomuraea sp. NPDC047529]|uniref:hypothetical protein n=1 Tax=Nonomuraea sp. NPDC047529 TaxID=3155623 RepID=UPI0033D6BCD9